MGVFQKEKDTFQKKKKKKKKSRYPTVGSTECDNTRFRGGPGCAPNGVVFFRRGKGCDLGNIGTTEGPDACRTLGAKSCKHSFVKGGACHTKAWTLVGVKRLEHGGRVVCALCTLPKTLCVGKYKLFTFGIYINWGGVRRKLCMYISIKKKKATFQGCSCPRRGTDPSSSSSSPLPSSTTTTHFFFFFTNSICGSTFATSPGGPLLAMKHSTRF